MGVHPGALRLAIKVFFNTTKMYVLVGNLVLYLYIEPCMNVWRDMFTLTHLRSTGATYQDLGYFHSNPFTFCLNIITTGNKARTSLILTANHTAHRISVERVHLQPLYDAYHANVVSVLS